MIPLMSDFRFLFVCNSVENLINTGPWSEFKAVITCDERGR